MKKLIKSKLFLQVIVASLAATLATALIVSAATTIGANITTEGNVAMDTASSTGIVKFAQIRSDSGAISFDNENLSTTGTLAAGATTITGALTASTKIGVASTSPFGDFAVGAADATSTISMGKFCQFVQDQKGRSYWITLNMAAANAAAGIFATSTIPCNQ